MPFCGNGRGTRNQIGLINTLYVVSRDLKQRSVIWVWHPDGGHERTVSGGGSLQRETPPLADTGLRVLLDWTRALLLRPLDVFVNLQQGIHGVTQRSFETLWL